MQSVQYYRVWKFQEILKKCEEAVSDHKTYNDKYSKFVNMMTQNVGEKAAALNSLEGTQESLSARLAAIEALEATRPSHLAALNSVVEDGEKLYPSTADEGREVIRMELQRLQTSFDMAYDDLSALERSLSNKLNK